MTTTPEFIVVTTTHDDPEQARSLAKEVVGARLAACAQVYPIQSVYWWDGEVQDSEEWRIDFKTRADLAEPLGVFIGEHHTYDTPEVVGVPVATGSAAYLDWVRTETSER